MRKKLRKASAILVAMLPFNAVRKVAYRLLLGYRFGAGTRIGYRSVIAVDSFSCGPGTIISPGNRFLGAFSVALGRNVFIGRDNQFFGSDAAASAAQAHKGYKRALVLGDEALINNGHIFDVIGRIEIQDGSWIAGFRSQFLTHGVGVVDRDILIGPRTFVGSGVQVSPGSSIGADCIVAMGSVVTKKFSDARVILAGVPARILRQRSPDDEHGFARVW